MNVALSFAPYPHTRSRSPSPSFFSRRVLCEDVVSAVAFLLRHTARYNLAPTFDASQRPITFSSSSSSLSSSSSSSSSSTLLFPSSSSYCPTNTTTGKMTLPKKRNRRKSGNFGVAVRPLAYTLASLTPLLGDGLVSKK